MAKVIQTGTLPIGVLIADVLHRDFELRPVLVQDNIEAVTEVGTVNPVELSAAIFARQLVRLGTLERKQITTDLVRGMHIADFNEIERGAVELEKKLLLGGRISSGGAPAGSSSSATASPSTTP
jgi:hypothetical protein